MARYDRVLIDPTQDELFSVLIEAVGTANEKRRQRLLDWPLPRLADTLLRASEPCGWQQWNGGEQPARSGEGRSAVVLAWWTDRTGRKHHRVVGRHGPFNRPMLENLLCPFGEERPALWFVYPDHVFLKRQQGQRLLQSLCACGAHGSPDELGWMGPCCDACHDGAMEGRAITPAWLDPRLATLRAQEGRVMFLAYSPDGRTVAAGASRDEVVLWDVTTGIERGRLAGRDEWMLCAGWIDGGQRLVTCDVSGLLRYWSARTGLPTGVEVKTGSVAECFAVSADGELICRGNRSRSLLLSGRDGQPVRDLEGALPDVCCMAFSPDGRLLTGGSRHGSVAVWEVGSGKQRCRFDRHGVIITSLAFSPHGRTLAVGMVPAPGSSSVEADPVLLWNLRDDVAECTLAGHGGGTRAVVFSPDGRLLASGGEDGMVRLWDVSSAAERIGLEWHLDAVCALAFAPDGLTLASGSFDGAVKLWPCEILRPSRTLERIAR